MVFVPTPGVTGTFPTGIMMTIREEKVVGTFSDVQGAIVI